MEKLVKYWCHSCQKEFEDCFESAEGEEEEEAKCRFCNGVFIEQVENHEDSSDHPKNFEPYKIVESQPESSEPEPARQERDAAGGRSNFVMFNPGAGGRAVHIIHNSMNGGAPGRSVNSFLGMLNNLMNGFGGEDVYEGGLSLDQIMQQIINEDPNRYGPPPASKAVIKNLKRGTFLDFKEEKEEKEKEESKEGEKSEELDKSCNVCYDEFAEDEDKIIVQLPCTHIYHEECILPWLEEHNTCPH